MPVSSSAPSSEPSSPPVPWMALTTTSTSRSRSFLQAAPVALDEGRAAAEAQLDGGGALGWLACERGDVCERVARPPAPVARDVDREHGVLLAEHRHDLLGGDDRHVVLDRGAAEHDGDPASRFGHARSVVGRWAARPWPVCVQPCCVNVHDDRGVHARRRRGRGARASQPPAEPLVRAAGRDPARLGRVAGCDRERDDGPGFVAGSGRGGPSGVRLVCAPAGGVERGPLRGARARLVRRPGPLAREPPGPQLRRTDRDRAGFFGVVVAGVAGPADGCGRA